VRPACLLLDEPLSALDAQTRDLLLDEFAALITAAGTTTIYVTHNLAEAVRLGHQIVVLSRRPGEIRDVLRVDRPLAGRGAADPDLIALEQRLWRMCPDLMARLPFGAAALPPTTGRGRRWRPWSG
jgi:NitT/TauT family transport system ATP-binding protein